ncbi:helix-turn-helix domain-containing protein [Proteiniphilum sp. X52]|uniref:helix-turn-helix domain-containing protein n=1 Tax=Proteiniphilum sp. X52 TaxID=2382159 RepID=UPI000F09B688|nr:helix-turn-helix domain-containing protein [Proteiniphilum sp. X52]RNC64777.1 XRE family transcriptional regulator [Proteiniphilum sp. X52]
MTMRPTEKSYKRHIGRNIQRVRMYLGVKQEALGVDLGISQQDVSRIERDNKIEEKMISQIANVLGVPPDIIRDFDENKVINNINHIKDNTFHQNSPSSNIQQFDPFEKIVELYKRLLKSEKEKTELLKKR